MVCHRIAAFIGLAISAGLVTARPHAQVLATGTVDDPDAYAVYAAILPSEWIVRVAKATHLVIQEETVTMPRCMPSGLPMETDWKPLLESYGAANATTPTIRPGQQIGLPYRVVPSRVIRSAFDKPIPNGVSDGWRGFYRRYPDSGGYLEMSAVGFDPAKTRAMAYVGHSCGSLCGGGQHYLLERVDGVWREARIAGLTQCMWAS